MKASSKKLIITAISFLIFAVLGNSFLANDVHTWKQLLTNGEALEKVYYLFQIIASIFVMLGSLIAVWQYILSSRDSMQNREREFQLHEKEIFEMEKDRIQKAIDLSGYYKDSIIKDVSIILSIYTATGVKEILDKIDFDEIAHFDKYEMEKVISTLDRKKISDLSKAPKMLDALSLTSDITGLWDECRERVNIEEKDGKTIRSVTISYNAIMYRFQSMIRDLLNNLEYFAMNFTHNTADESVVYQSLHKVYTETVRMLYYDISANNIPGEAKLYTNVIELYNIWKKKAKDQKEDETSATRENISKGKTLKTIDKHNNAGTI